MATTNIPQVVNPDTSARQSPPVERHSRIPLAIRKASPLHKQSQTSPKTVRRKSSFCRRVDSSEEVPSPHASIYDASFFSNGNSDDGCCLDSWPLPPTSTAQSHSPQAIISPEHDENSRIGNPQPADDSPFIYGHGTVLNSIPESRSNATLRTVARAKSMEDLQKKHLDGIRNTSYSSFFATKSPRRKQSFSFDDITSINNSYHEAITVIERTARKTSLKVDEVYAEPKLPVHEPPNRPATPPGMPSWTAHQNMPPRPQGRPNPKPQNRFQRFFGLPSSFTFSSRVTARRSASAPINMARFRPPRSAYSPMAQHPFNRAPIARINQPPTVPPPAASHIAPTERPRPTIFGSPRFQRLLETGKRKPGQTVRFSSSSLMQGPLFQLPQTPGAPSNTPVGTRVASPISPYRLQQSTTLQPWSPPIGAVATKQKQCQHKKTRRKLLKPLHWVIPTTPLSAQGDPPPTTQEFTEPPRLCLPRQDSFSCPTSPEEIASFRSISVCSTTHLISDSLIDPSPSTSPAHNLLPGPPRPATPHFQHDPTTSGRCWKCKLEGFAEKCMDLTYNVVHESRDCFCLLCCGYDGENDSRPGSTYGWNGRYVDANQGLPPTAGYQCIGRNGDPAISRSEVLACTPVVF